MAAVGQKVKWSTSRQPLGVVVHTFNHKGIRYVVVERPNGSLVVARDYHELEVVT